MRYSHSCRGTVYTSQRLQDNIIVGRNLKKTLLPLQAIAPRTGVDYSLREMEDNFLVYNHYSLKKIKQNVESYDEDIDHRKQVITYRLQDPFSD